LNGRVFIKAGMLAVLALVAACSQNPVETLRVDDGRYQLVLEPVTQLSRTGYSCNRYRGALRLRQERLTGDLRSEQGQLYQVAGYAMMAGELYQARMVHYLETVELSGHLLQAQGEGNWHTASGCEGIWWAKRRSSTTEKDNDRSFAGNEMD